MNPSKVLILNSDRETKLTNLDKFDYQVGSINGWKNPILQLQSDEIRNLLWTNNVPFTEISENLRSANEPQVDVAQSTTNLIRNGSFEISRFEPGSSFVSLNPGSIDIAGWTVTRGQIDYKGTIWQADNGTKSLDLNGTPGIGGIAQIFNTTIGRNYVVTFAMAGNPGGGTLLKKIRVAAAGQFKDFSFNTTGKNFTNMGWRTFSWSFTASTTRTTLEFYSLSTESENVFYGPVLDDVVVKSNPAVSENLVGTVGRDLLNGGGGNDVLIGEAGNDVLNGNIGDDELIGDLGNDYLFGGTGDDNLSGGAGNDTLIGSLGTDILIGGQGNDIYYVDSIDDFVVEQGISTADRVVSSRSYTLGATVEQLVLSGQAISGVGNARNNAINGNQANNILRGQAGNDILNGLAGNDILVGGAGRDTLTSGLGTDNFVFSVPSEGVDIIRDFSRLNDTVKVSGVGFGGNLTRNSAISSQQLVYGTSAQDSSDRFIYDPDTGRLFFDADGTGVRAKIHFATFSTQPFLAASDIFVV